MNNDNNTLQVWAIYLLTDNGPIVVGITTDEQDAWAKWMPLKYQHDAGYMKDYINGVRVDRVDVTDAVCKEIGDAFFADKEIPA